MRNRFRWVAAVAGIALALLPGPSPVLARPAALPATLRAAPTTTTAATLSTSASSPELRVMTWNVCGEAGGDPGMAGYCPHRNEPVYKAQHIADAAAAHDANVILLQEICGGEDGSQLSLLAADLGPGWSVVHAKAARPDGTGNCRDNKDTVELKGDLGVAVAVKATITETTRQDTVPATPAYSAQQLPLLCVRTAEWTTRICTTHILAEVKDPRRGAQIENVRADVWADRYDLVLGGDFNMFPDTTLLQPLEDAFDECDRHSYSSGDAVNEVTHFAWTTGGGVWTKRDHIFASLPGAGSLFHYCDADLSRVDTSQLGLPASNGDSDHAPLIGYLRTRTPADPPATAGDLTGDGLPDLAAIDGDGKLRLYAGRGDGSVVWPNGVIGTGGWTGAAISHRGDFTGDGTEDVLARVGDGLWIYPNLGYGRLGSRVAVGATGWSAVSQVLSVGDLTGDGYPDVVAIRGDQLYLYPGDPAHRPALLAGRLIGTGGWGVMTLSAPGDADHDGRPDLLARDTASGVLYLYRGQAGATFGARTVYGTRGWTLANRPLIAAGDADGNGTADLWATAGDGTLQFYAGGTGAAGDPADGPRTQVGDSGWNAITRIS
ncbi:FG-GAP-like repeat-containing protein [Hamadaea tsunoensis]|uniref:FG-GAP-like repeat-containing protein n=1 Tax=Hamadaea tsunoensis TaxID=53368 RepID=UPI000421BC67|nr:FG-GAP-like repeat-containing protein [Hamadaea tsunoensis]